MTLLQTLKTALTKARIDKDETTKSVLSVVVGEAETLQFSKGQKGEVTDQQVARVIQNVIKGNEDAIQQAEAHGAEEAIPKLQLENKILQGFLPQMWGKAQIEEALLAGDSIVDQIKQAGNDGQATGIAMKFLKSQKAPVQGGDVAEVVKVLRDNP